MINNYNVGDRYQLSDESWFQITEIKDDQFEYILSSGEEHSLQWSAFEYWMIGIDRDDAELAKFVGNFDNDQLILQYHKLDS